MNLGRNFLFDQEIERVDWAEPENEVDDDVMAKVKVLFIRNLSAQTSEDDIEKVFEECSEGQVERVKKTKDYAFVHFNTRDAAERAFKATKDDLLIDNCQIEVSWSKPIDRQLHNQRKQLTKVMTFGPSSMKEVATIPPMPAAMPNNYVTASQPLIMHNDMRLSNYATAPLIAPRTRGAAGIRGLGTFHSLIFLKKQPWKFRCLCFRSSWHFAATKPASQIECIVYGRLPAPNE